MTAPCWRRGSWPFRRLLSHSFSVSRRSRPPPGGESGGRRAVRLRGGRAGSVSGKSLRGAAHSYQSVMQRQPRTRCIPYAGGPLAVPSSAVAQLSALSLAALGRTIISRSGRSAPCSASEVIATRMTVADGCYTGEMEFCAYGEAKASRPRELAAARLSDWYAYSDSATDLPILVGRAWLCAGAGALRTCSGHVNRQNHRDHELVTPGASQGLRSVV
jgi:hypothetical protein